MPTPRAILRCLISEDGGEVLEYAIISGLIVVVAIAAITSVGCKTLSRWTTLNSRM